jgi:hypothetical protein
MSLQFKKRKIWHDRSCNAKSNKRVRHSRNSRRRQRSNAELRIEEGISMRDLLFKSRKNSTWSCTIGSTNRSRQLQRRRKRQAMKRSKKFLESPRYKCKSQVPRMKRLELTLA